MQRSTAHNLDLAVDIAEVLLALAMLVLGIFCLARGSYRLTSAIALLGAVYNALVAGVRAVHGGRQSSREILLHTLLALFCLALAYVMFRTVF